MKRIIIKYSNICQVWVYEDILRGVKAAKEAGLNVCAVYDEDSAGDWEDIKELADKALELV